MIDQSEALTALTGDVASFYNLSTDEAFTKLKAVYTGETEALKSLGVVMTQTALDEFAMAKGMGKTTKQMSEQEKVSLRLAFVTDRLKGASDDFSRTAGGWANQTKVLKLRFDQLKATLGQGFINILTPTLGVINELLEKLQAVADVFVAWTEVVFGDAGGSSSLGGATDASGSIADNMGSISSSSTSSTSTPTHTAPSRDAQTSPRSPSRATSKKRASKRASDTSSSRASPTPRSTSPPSPASSNP